jgi:hypothetical protein
MLISSKLMSNVGLMFFNDSLVDSSHLVTPLDAQLMSASLNNCDKGLIFSSNTQSSQVANDSQGAVELEARVVGIITRVYWVIKLSLKEGEKCLLIKGVIAERNLDVDLGTKIVVEDNGNFEGVFQIISELFEVS